MAGVKVQEWVDILLVIHCTTPSYGIGRSLLQFGVVDFENKVLYLGQSSCAR